MPKLKFRPYARLLTMLGDQLIKNEQIALIELIKNSYDADASYCKVFFQDFIVFNTKDDINGLDGMYESKTDSCICIEDDGIGMTYETILNHFMNPATSYKQDLYRLNHETKKGRVMQGEKGIGRFSMLKLGSKIEISTKTFEEKIVHKLEIDFSLYNDDFSLFNENNKSLYLDEIKADYQSIPIENYNGNVNIIKNGQGTEIKISFLKGKWDNYKIIEVMKSINEMTPLNLSKKEYPSKSDFSCTLYANSKILKITNIQHENLKDIIENRCLIRIANGRYNELLKCMSFDISVANEPYRNEVLYFTKISNSISKRLHELAEYKNDIVHFFDNNKSTSCGDFVFDFYIFDFESNSDDPFGLSTKAKQAIKRSGIYLYRDGIRIQPYGSPTDDWLGIDKTRAATRANLQFAKGQVIGQIGITKENNLSLKDKSSREGIIESDDSFTHLTSIIRIFLSTIRTYDYQKYQAKKTQKDKLILEKKARYLEPIAEMKEQFADNPKVLRSIEKISNSFASLNKMYTDRIDRTERLAGVGISVETASHDIMLTLNRLRESIASIKNDLQSPISIELNMEDLKKNAISSEEMLALVILKLTDMQSLFVSTKQRTKQIRVIEVVKKIESIYRHAYNKKNISVKYNEIFPPVYAKTIDAVLYQVFINLFDNSLYFLEEIDSNRTVQITFDGPSNSVIFSDNGPGILKDDEPFIFEAFYSTKGEEGRGLGLYIARKLLSKYNYDISIVNSANTKLLRGANFVISFLEEQESSRNG